MNKKNVYGAIAITFIVAVLALFVGVKTPQVITKAVSNLTTNLPSLGVNTLGIGPGCDQSFTTCIGSITGSTGLSLTGSMTFNGVVSTSTRISMTTATDTPCAILSPAATSTIDFFGAVVSSSTAVTATTYTLATSTTQYATTSIISYFPVATSTASLGGFAATTTIATGGQGNLTYYGGSAGILGQVSPSTYVVLGVQGGTGKFGTAAQVGGTCQITFRQL